MSAKCPECNLAYKDCACRFDTIIDVLGFLRHRAEAVAENRGSQVTTIQKAVFLLNHIMDNLPQWYVTRSGCEAEEHPTQAHSDHDTARMMGVLLVTEFNEIVVNLCSGAHNSARRNTRSMLEWMFRVIAAVSDRGIFTENPQDANRAICFDGLRIAIAWSDARKRNRKKRHQQTPELPQGVDHEKAVRFRDFLASADIPGGLGSIPNKLNCKIMSNFPRPSVKKADTSAWPYYIYGELSQSVHNSIDKVDDMPHGGATPFFDRKSFDRSYAIIYAAMDIILCLYFILIDIDVFYSDADGRKQYREYVEKAFADTFGQHKFDSCRTLFDSKVWKDPLLEFTRARAG